MNNLPYEQQDLVFRLQERARIRRQIPTRKSVQEGKQDRMADLLDEAAAEIVRLRAVVNAPSTPAWVSQSSPDYLDGPMIKLFRDD